MADKKKILVVDDEQDILTILDKRLSKEGYLVIKADNGRDAIRLAKSELPDLVLLDIVMPDMSGSDVAERLKKDIATKDITVMFLTCLFTKKDEIEKGHEIGGNFFIAKPYDPKELLGEIKKRLPS
ncbi:MAG: response regulator [Candidatus Omnitrophica bacterium]|nr:response regulator [Candidatus Omnitrophota bacterium]